MKTLIVFFASIFLIISSCSKSLVDTVDLDEDLLINEEQKKLLSLDDEADLSNIFYAKGKISHIKEYVKGNLYKYRFVFEGKSAHDQSLIARSFTFSSNEKFDAKLIDGEVEILSLKYQVVVTQAGGIQYNFYVSANPDFENETSEISTYNVIGMSKLTGLSKNHIISMLAGGKCECDCEECEGSECVSTHCKCTSQCGGSCESTCTQNGTAVCRDTCGEN